MLKRFFVLLLFLCCFSSIALAESLDADQLSSLLRGMEQGSTVDLTDADLSLAQRRSLVAEYPQLHFKWEQNMFGLQVTSEDTVLDFTGKTVKDFKLLCDYLDCFPQVKKVILYKNTTFLDDKEYLHQRHPDVLFCWDLKVLDHRMLNTEMTAFSTLNNGAPPYLYSRNLWWVKHCLNLQGLDLGHNMIKELDFLYDAPKLKVLILACNKVTDLTPLACQTELEYLELFLNDITDVTPLAGLTNLKDLNLCFNQITDITPLYGLDNLERLWLSWNYNLPQEQIDKMQELHPDLEIVTRSNGSTGDIWLDENKTPAPGWRTHPRYFVIKQMFATDTYLPWDAEVPVK